MCGKFIIYALDEVLVMRPAEVPVWLGPGYRTLADRSSIDLTAQPELLPGQQLPLL